MKRCISRKCPRPARARGYCKNCYDLAYARGEIKTIRPKRQVVGLRRPLKASSLAGSLPAVVAPWEGYDVNGNRWVSRGGAYH